MEKIFLTKEGKKKLEEEYNKLINVDRPKNIKDLAEARAQGDLKENADYDAAKNDQSKIELRINEIENIFRNCDIIEEDHDTKVVNIGSKVTFEEVSSQKKQTYFIVGTIESDPINNKISNESPFGIAVLGHKIGDIVDVKSEKMIYKVKIINIEKD
ncbi:MAG: transcription elongation factor GreA [Bacilli bacterium]|nr:transcription elongation factor GreA [Bacilli bacterium]